MDARGGVFWQDEAVRAAAEWTVLLPFFNERDYLDDTLASLAAQHERPFVILIDNGSTDGSAHVATAAARTHGLDHLLLTETRPGKVAALAAGLRHVATPYVATCDADTWYPRHYLAEAKALLERDGSVAAGAYFVRREAGRLRRMAEACHIVGAARFFPSQCHAGGAGQVFHTAALRLAGGFDPARWNLVLEDHEIVHQVMKLGAMRYSTDLWCAPSPRKRDRASVKWTAAERLRYATTVGRDGDRFFRDYLAPRLIARSLSSDRLRERQHQTQPPSGYVQDQPAKPRPHPVFSDLSDATPYSVC
jgi:glycosyltransferase involved in cell wall biosynthesis